MLCRRISMTSRVLLLLLTLGYDEYSCDAGKTTALWRQWMSAMGGGGGGKFYNYDVLNRLS